MERLVFGLMSLVLESIGRTILFSEERIEAIVSDPDRERLLEVGGNFESVEELPRWDFSCASLSSCGLDIVWFAIVCRTCVLLYLWICR